MQTAKNVFLWPDRDWLRKGFEAWFTALIELAWGKRRIMEIYVNVVEWGPGIYGAEAAARYYFRKSADALNPEEAVRLAAALPDPIGWPPRPSPARPQRRDPCELAGRPLDAALALRARCIISQPALLTYRGRRISAARWIPSRDSPAAQGGPQKFVFYGAR